MVRIQNLRAVANGSFQLEVSDNAVVKPGQRPNLLSLLNSDDSRFANNARLAWIKVTPANGELYFGIPKATFDSLEEGDEVDLDIVNPAIDGHPLRVEVRESTIPMDDYQKANTRKAAKSIEIKEGTLKARGLNLSPLIDASKVGERAYFMTNEGEFIYSKTEVVVGEPKHEFVVEEQVLRLESEVFASDDEPVQLTKKAAIVNKTTVK